MRIGMLWELPREIILEIADVASDMTNVYTLAGFGLIAVAIAWRIFRRAIKTTE